MQTQKLNLAKLGIIAGSGNLPLNIINNAIESGREFYLIVIDDKSSDLYPEYPHSNLPIGMVGAIINTLKEQQVQEVVLAGAIKKPALSSLKTDKLGAKLIARILKNKLLGDDSILSIIVKFIEEQGFKVTSAADYLPTNSLSPGVLTIAQPDEQSLIDIELGKKIALAIGALDIGQAVIVENSIVLGVEAIEGTKELIARCTSYKLSPSPSGCLIKMKKPQQEIRADLPSIGVLTIAQLHQAGFKGVAIEASGSTIIDLEEMLRVANNLGIFVVAI